MLTAIVPAHGLVYGMRIAKLLDTFSCRDIGDDLAVSCGLGFVAYRIPLHRMPWRQWLRESRDVWLFSGLPSHDRVALKFGGIGG